MGRFIISFHAVMLCLDGCGARGRVRQALWNDSRGDRGPCERSKPRLAVHRRGLGYTSTVTV